MHYSGCPYLSRTVAGRCLAEEFEHYRGFNAGILAIPRGCIPVAAEVALELIAIAGFYEQLFDLTDDDVIESLRSFQERRAS